VLKPFPTYYVKRSLGAANLFFSAAALTEFVDFGRAWGIHRQDWTWDWMLLDQLVKCGYGFYAVRPSVVQHIGQWGLNSSLARHDWALDYVCPYHHLNLVLWPLVKRWQRLVARLKGS
jgi:hypothetical protein